MHDESPQPRPINGTSYLPRPLPAPQSPSVSASPPRSSTDPSSSPTAPLVPPAPASSAPSRSAEPMVWDEPTVEERTLAAEDRAIMFLAQHRRLRVLLLLLLATGAALGWVALVAMFVNHNR